MRKIALVAAAALIPLIPAAPAYAAAHVICVGSPAGSCDETAPSIQAAISQANGNGQTNTILVGPGTYTDGPYNMDGSAHGLTFAGSGQGVTFLTLPASGTSQTYLSAQKMAVQDLTVTMTGTSSGSDAGLFLSGSTAERVSVEGPGTSSAFAFRVMNSTVSHATVTMPNAPGTGNRAVYAEGGSVVSDSVLTATYGLLHTGDNTTDAISRVVMRVGTSGVSTDSGDVAVDDSLIDLGSTGGAGLAAVNLNNNAEEKMITADHVTIVGGGIGSRGVWAYAAVGTALQQAEVTLTDSIIEGPETDLVAQAGNNGSQGGTSTATINTSHSDWSTTDVQPGANGAATLNSTAGHLDVDPGFENPASGDYRLGLTSPVIDKGAPGAGTPTTDLSTGPRVLDGDGDGLAVRDMGAYEAPTRTTVPSTTAPGTTAPDTTPPDTTISSHPKKHTTKHRATFGFTSNESHVTFQCRLDKLAWSTCASPRSYRVTRGWHVVKVRARDAAGNLDATPASWRFKRV